MRAYPPAPEKSPGIARFLLDRQNKINALAQEFLLRVTGKDGLEEIAHLLNCLIRSIETGALADNGLAPLIERLRRSEGSIADYLAWESSLMMAVHDTVDT